MPRRQQRRFVPRKGAPKTGRDEDTGALDASARRVLLAANSDPQRLEALVVDLAQLKEEADRVAFADPSPIALREYRRAARELAEAQRAVVLANAG